MRTWLFFGLVFLVVVRIGVAQLFESNNLEQECLIEKELRGEVIDLRIETERVQIRVQDEEGCVVLVYAGRWLDVNQGDLVELSGDEYGSRQELPSELAGYGEYLKREGVAGTWRWPEVRVLVKANNLDVDAVNTGLSNEINFLWTEPVAGVLQAMLLGKRGQIDEGILDSMRKTGTAHVIAISGLHISLVAGLVYGLLLWLPLSAKWRIVIGTSVVWFYVWLVAAPISSVRAGWFWTFLMLALALRRLIALPAIVVMTASFLLLVDPELIFDVGFQLSLSAVTGIWLGLWLTRVWKVDSDWKKWLIGSLVVPVSAAMATGPIIAYHFGLVSGIGVLANLVIVPLVSLVVPWAWLAVGLSLIWELLGLVIAWPVQNLLSSLLELNRWLASLPGASWEIAISWRLVVVYYACVMASVGYVSWRQGRSWREIWV